MQRSPLVLGGWDGIAESALQRFAVDVDHLKRVSVQMHGMRHGGLVDELQGDTLTGLDLHLGFLAAGFAVSKTMPLMGQA